MQLLKSNDEVTPFLVLILRKRATDAKFVPRGQLQVNKSTGSEKASCKIKISTNLILGFGANESEKLVKPV